MGKPQLIYTIGNFRFEKQEGSNIINIFNARTGVNVDCFTQYNLSDQSEFEKSCRETHAEYAKDWS
ncbi:hypothetical protein [Paenibacillus sp. HB172176]|uniref:hypothetical protein n=1 Tax=Paenibacillus sp. HB172176 TaxID=2493690 RepID=UPI00143C23FF|nr:hypothetical protein [Paenibacillus sp. HB172176]